MSTSTPAPGSFVGENDKYRVVRLIGEGGMGVVFEAEHTLTQKRVALKWMLPELARTPDLAARFLREAQAAARVRHPNVVDVYDYGKQGDAAYLVMEYLEGETLTAALTRGDLPLSTVLGLLLPAMRAVASAHKQGVIHRDIKPDNIFLSRHEDLIEAKVLDFGISKLETPGAQAVSLTRTGTAMGTPNYMSYEQLIAEKQIDGRTDVYAFGVILYEILTGRLPFEAETFSALIVKVATTEPKPTGELRADIPVALQNLVHWAMRKNRDERCPSMDALIAALEPFGAEKSGPSYPSLQRSGAAAALADVRGLNPVPLASALAATQARTRSHTPLIVAAVAGLLLVLCGVVLFGFSRSTPHASNLPPSVPTVPAAPALVPAASAPSPVTAEKPHRREEHPQASPAQPVPSASTVAETLPAATGSGVAAHRHAGHARGAEGALPKVAATVPDSTTRVEQGPAKHAVSAEEPEPKPAVKPEDTGWYVTPEGRRIMRAPTPGKASPNDTQLAPYTTTGGRVVIPAP